MGAFTSRSNAGEEEVDLASNNAYRYPPKMGKNHLKRYIRKKERKIIKSLKVCCFAFW